MGQLTLFRMATRSLKVETDFPSLRKGKLLKTRIFYKARVRHLANLEAPTAIRQDGAFSFALADGV
jgi:hypothetical protein